MIPDKKNSNDRPEAYPKPTETDTQLNHQSEYTEPSPNKIDDQDSTSDELQQAQERMKKTGNSNDR